MSDKQLILAFFADEPAAEAAASALKDSGVADSDAIGILVVDATGNVVVDKVGATSVAAGVGIGAALLVLGPYFLGVGVWPLQLWAAGSVWPAAPSADPCTTRA